MGRLEVIDPALELNRRAQAEGWPFRCDAALCFEHPELNALRDIWHSLADGRCTPSRADFDARTLKPFLRNISIVERVFVDTAKWRYRIRLSGSANAEVAGEQTGQFLDACIPPEFLLRWTTPCNAVLDSGMPIRLIVDFQIPALAYLNGESLVAPLADARGEITLLLVCLYFKPKQPRAAS